MKYVLLLNLNLLSGVNRRIFTREQQMRDGCIFFFLQVCCSSLPQCLQFLINRYTFETQKWHLIPVQHRQQIIEDYCYCKNKKKSPKKSNFTLFTRTNDF